MQALYEVSLCLRELLYPLQWSHVFIPVLPRSLLDTLMCPTPFLVGIHKSYAFKHDFPYVVDVVIIDLDNKTVRIPDQSLLEHTGGLMSQPERQAAGNRLMTSVGGVAKFPSHLVSVATYELDRIFREAYYASDSLSQAGNVDSNEARNNSVQRVFKNLMTELVYPLDDFTTRIGKGTDVLTLMHKKGFMDSLDQSTKSFYDAFLQTQCCALYLAQKHSATIAQK